MVPNPPVLEVDEAGRLTVVGFGSHRWLGHVDVVDCRDEILALVRQHACEVLAFDLTGVQFIPSGMIGLLASLRREELEVHIDNPSADVREVLAVTKMDRIMTIHEVTF